MGEYFPDESLSVMSSLIGLARSLEGDEEPLECVMSLLRNATLAVSRGDIASPEALKGELLEAKKKTVPSCFVCPQPCGHNDDYPMDRLSDLDSLQVREVLSLLDEIITSERVSGKKRNELTLKGLVYISSGFGDEYMRNLTAELKEALQ